MFSRLRMFFRLLHETISEDGLINIYQGQVWKRKIAVPAEFDLSNISEQVDRPILDAGYEFVEIKLAELRAGNLHFLSPNHRAKSIYNLKKGWRGFALIKDSVIVGFVWCSCADPNKGILKHPHLRMLGLNGHEMEGYIFDMIIAPPYRGKLLSIPFQKYLLLSLKKEGYRKVYSFYWQDNIPAMRFHQRLSYRELPKRWVSRFFFIKRFGWE